METTFTRHSFTSRFHLYCMDFPCFLAVPSLARRTVAPATDSPAPRWPAFRALVVQRALNSTALCACGRGPMYFQIHEPRTYNISNKMLNRSFGYSCHGCICSWMLLVLFCLFPICVRLRFSSAFSLCLLNAAWQWAHFNVCSFTWLCFP